MEKFWSLYKTETLQKIQKKYFFWVLIFLAIFIPLYPKFPLLNIHGTYVAVRIEDILIALTALVWLFCFRDHLKQFLGQTIFQAILLFWVIGGLSFISGLYVTHTVFFQLGLLHWLRRVEYMLLFVIGATSLASFSQVKLLYRSIMLTALGVCLYGLGQVWLHLPVISTGNREFSKGLVGYLTSGARVNSTFAGPYDLAIYLSLILVTLASIFFYYHKLSKRLGIMLLGVLCFGVLGLTAARMTFLTTLLGVSLVFWLHNKKIFVLGLIVLGLVTVVAVPDLRHRLVATFTVNILSGGGPKYTPSPGTVNIYTDISKYPKSQQALLRQKIEQEATRDATQSSTPRDVAPGEPLNSTELGVYRSLGIRTNVEWPRALRAFERNPVLGTGYSSISLATDNDLLRSLGEVGLLGTISIALIFITLLKKMCSFLGGPRNFRKCWIIAMFCGVLSVLASGLFIDVLEASKISEVFWLFMGISWALMTNQELAENV